MSKVSPVMTSIADLLAAGPTRSVEFFPPRDEAAERQFSTALSELVGLGPSFASVTYGALGSTQSRTREIVVEMNADLDFPTMAHLTCVGHTRDEITRLLDQYAEAGVRNLLALGGDPAADGSPTRGDFTYAIELVDDYRTADLGTADGRTLYLGNPPYVRHHQIAAGGKEWLTLTARAHGFEASQLAGLHVHFFLATAVRARPGDGGALVTSSEWLDTNYGGLVRELLLGPLGGESIHVLEPTAVPFDDAAVTAAITCFSAAGRRPAAIRVRRVESVSELDALAAVPHTHL